MIVETKDGERFVGRTAADVLRAMKNDTWNAPDQKLPWKQEVAERVLQQSGMVLPMRPAQAFLDALVAAGYVSVLPFCEACGTEHGGGLAQCPPVEV